MFMMAHNSEIDKKQKIFSELQDYLRNTSAPKHFVQLIDTYVKKISKGNYDFTSIGYTEPIETEMSNGCVIFTKQDGYCIEGNDNLSHQLIEGENLAALKYLSREYRGGIDVICIDPPYNTGMSELIYSDHLLTGSEDFHQHNIWLSFMKKRLVIAYELLSDSGVLFINIDEHEIANLLLLCNNIFCEVNTDVLIWPKTDPLFDENRVEKPYDKIKITHEYVIVCFKNKLGTSLNKMKMPIWINGRYSEESKDMETILKGLGTTSSAKDELSEIFGSRDIFQTPKPRKLIKELVRAASHSKSVVLDFFAGSGTTAVAVSDLNKEDGGNRKCILVTNNENDICKTITFERLKFTKAKEDFKEGIEYYIVDIHPFHQDK
jgi:adenine-specific DNA-methyltransferase